MSNLTSQPIRLADVSPEHWTNVSTFIEQVFPLNKSYRRPNVNRKKIRNPLPLADLQQAIFIDHITEDNYSSFDKYYLTLRSGYGIRREPTSVSNGLAACLLFAGKDPRYFANTLANTRVLFSPEADWIEEWLSRYYPAYHRLFLQLAEEVFTLRTKQDFKVILTDKYEFELYSGEIIRGTCLTYKVDFIRIELDDPNEPIGDRKSPSPHIRKAHKRRVRYGRGRQFTKWVDISETSVNHGD